MKKGKKERSTNCKRSAVLGKTAVRGIVFFAAVLLLCFIVNVPSKAEGKIIKVGAITGNSFIENTDGVYHGYGVEYLEEIAQYTGWEYTYVFDTWDNCIKRLESGELDMLCNMQYTRERADRYLYAQIPLGYDYSIIYAHPDSDIFFEDYDAMKGAKVGLMAKSNHSESFLKQAEALELNSEVIYYDTEEAMVKALMNNDVELIVTGSIYSRNDLKAVGRFGTVPYYCVTTNKQIRLMNELDEALQNIKVENPGIEASLAEKYYGDNQVSSSPLFTREENEYIENREPVRVRLMVNSQPLSYIDKAGNPKGIFVEYLKLLSEKSGLQFKIEIAMDSTGMEKQTERILEEDYIMLRSKRALEANGLDERLIMTNPVLTTRLSYVKHKNKVADTRRNDYVFAITNEMGYFEDMLQSKGAEYQVKYYKDTEACLDAVIKGEADIAAQDSYGMTYLLQKPKYAQNLVECPGEECTNGMCLIASKDEQILIQILNKTINYISEDESDSFLTLELLLNPYELTIGDVLYRYGYMILIVIVVLVGAVATYTILMRRMTKLEFQKKEYELLQKKVQQDELTGVYNRPAFLKKARKLIDNTEEEMCIVLMDISNFKVINDLYGSKTGDRLLRHLADELKQRGKDKDFVVGRFNSDHFYMCMKMADFAQMQFPKRYKTFLQDMDVTVIYGVFQVGDNKDVPVNIMCDRASLAAHDEGRKRREYIRYYSDDERKKLIREQEIVNDMEKALEERQFSVFIQPKYNIFENKIVGGEALVRWFHPQKGMVSPGEFIPVFEKNGFIIPLDYYVWEETCRFVSELKKKGYDSLPISVNVSRAHFYGKELKDKLEELITKYGLDKTDIELEITETICAEDPDIIYKRVKELQESGFKVAMDDFGSGYSSLNMLKEMPLDIIKMDLKFLDGGDNEEKSRNILGTLISLAKSMDLYVVVEGVETKEQVEFLQSIGTRCAQGYYYSRPVDCPAFEVMLIHEKEKNENR